MILCYLVIVLSVYLSLCFSVFFFKQKTAYEMRISDWRSDVCSSDLRLIRLYGDLEILLFDSYFIHPRFSDKLNQVLNLFDIHAHCLVGLIIRSEERRVGKECVIRVDLGGRRIIKKKTNI